MAKSRRTLAENAMAAHGASEGHGRRVAGLSRTVKRYEPEPREDSDVMHVLGSLAERHR
jgi:hypothetical protein